MTIFSRKQTTVGLDIGSGLVKAAVVEHGPGAPALTKVVVTPLPDDAIVEGEVMDPHLVVQAVRETLAATGTKNRNVVVAVGGRDVIVKKIRTERVKAAQARELLRLEAQQHVPFDMDSVELDFQLLDPHADGLEMDVLLVAAKRDLVEAKMRLLEDAGVRPRLVDVDAFALHNAFETSYPDAMSGVIALANVGHEVTNVNVLDGGVPVLTRDLVIGTRRMREDVQREGGLTADSAEQALRRGDTSPQLTTVITRHAEELAAGIERATAVLEGARASGPLKAIYLCGGGARVAGLAAAVANRLRVRVELATPFVGLDVRDGALDGLRGDELAPLLMLPIGLALRKAA
jgi:type IV pilus assembly protein PilM